MKKLYIIFLLLSIPIMLFAQGENNNWFFGRGHHINFNTNPATHNYQSSITGVSSVTQSDAQGNLLFYATNCTIWDKNGNIMPNGYDLGSYWNTNSLFNSCNYYYNINTNIGWEKQSIFILPNPSNTNQFYVIDAANISSNFGINDTIFYSLVDMTLNSGLGDIVPGEKNKTIIIPNYTSWNATITFGDCNNYWLLLRGYEVYTYITQETILAFELNENGFNPNPVINILPNGNFQNEQHYGAMKFYNNEPILYINNFWNGSYLNGVLIDTTFLYRAEFNRNTGHIYNFDSINVEGLMDFEFSASGKYLYTCFGLFDSIFQFDLSLYPDINAIQASKTGINSPQPNQYYSAFQRMRLGPDGKIYILKDTVLCQGPYGMCFTIGRIESPELQGVNANFQPDIFTYPIDTFGALAFGQKVLARQPHRDSIKVSGAINEVKMLCENDTIPLESTRSNITFYKWSNGSTENSIEVTHSGIYWVQSFSEDCKIYIDTFLVSLVSSIFEEQNDTTICAGDEIIIDASIPGNNSYLWSNGSTTPQIRVNTAGDYYVNVRSENCSHSDTFTVANISPYFDILQSDTTICNGSKIILQVESNMNSSIFWNNNNFGNLNEVTDPGKYVAYTENICGKQADSLYIDIMDCSCRPIAPSAFTPNNDGKNDIFLPMLNLNCDAKYYELKIFNRWGELIFSAFDPNHGWDGKYKGKNAEMGVYYYLIKVINNHGSNLPNLSKGEIHLIR